MAAPQAIPDQQIVYRGLNNSNWRDKRGNISYKAFLLRPPNDQFPDPERELSLGLTPESAVDELNEHHGTAALRVVAAHGLPHNLRVLPDPDNPAKAEMHGLPLFSTDPAQRASAIAIGTDLAYISWFVPVPNVAN
jgi:hypothetical protein